MISLNFLCDDAFADPWIMPGAVDITDATEIEDYIPEVETITYYDEYGMPRNENGDIIGSMWCYDPETELYCIYSNEGELTNQKEYPYDISDMELGELDIRLSYQKRCIYIVTVYNDRFCSSLLKLSEAADSCMSDKYFKICIYLIIFNAAFRSYYDWRNLSNI